MTKTTLTYISTNRTLNIVVYHKLLALVLRLPFSKEGVGKRCSECESTIIAYETITISTHAHTRTHTHTHTVTCTHQSPHVHPDTTMRLTGRKTETKQHLSDNGAFKSKNSLTPVLCTTACKSLFPVRATTLSA